MLHILVLLLKIIGILLLAVLGLLLAGLIVVLAVPIRYRGDGVLERTPQGRITITWLFHALKAELCFDKDLRVKVRALWFVIMDEILWPDTEEPEKFPDGIEDETVPAREESETETVHAMELVEEEPESEMRQDPTNELESETEPQAVSDRESVSRINKLLKRIASWIRKLFMNLKAFFLNMEEKVDTVRKQYRKFERLISDEKNQRTFRLIRKQVKVMIRHILPLRLKGWIRFGFDDPYYTGQVLSAISPFYALYAKNLQVEPVFDEKTIAGELHFKGRIRAARILWCGARILLDKNFRKLLRKIRS